MLTNIKTALLCAALTAIAFVTTPNLFADSHEDGDCCCQCCEFPCGFIIGAEAAILTHYAGESRAGNPPFEVAPRAWVGWNNCQGLGVRIRGFHYKNEHHDNSANDRYEVATIDGEITQLYNLCCHTQILFSFGGRYAWYREEDVNTSPDLDAFDGGGAILGMEWTRCLCGGFSLFAIGRVSLLFGDDEEGEPGRDLHDLASITEVQFGIEWESCWCDYDFFIRGSFDTAHWSAIAAQDSEPFGLMGGTIGAGVFF